MADERGAGDRALRTYALIRLSRGDYLLPSNDARTLWRLYAYEEDGSAEVGGRAIRGTYWNLWRWQGGSYPTPVQLAVALANEDWSCWESWSTLHRTREAAIADAMRTT